MEENTALRGIEWWTRTLCDSRANRYHFQWSVCRLQQFSRSAPMIGNIERMETHSLALLFLKTSTAVTALSATSRASMTAISTSCFMFPWYLRTASHRAHAKLNDVETKGEVDFVVQSI